MAHLWMQGWMIWRWKLLKDLRVIYINRIWRWRRRRELRNLGTVIIDCSSIFAKQGLTYSITYFVGVQNAIPGLESQIADAAEEFVANLRDLRQVR